MSARKHAGPATDHPAVPQPSFAEQARTLMHLGRVGSLSTLSRQQPGYPFGSVMPYGLDGRGRPILLISTMAMHTQNVRADPRTSLLVTPPAVTTDPLGAARLTLIGNTAVVPSQESAEARGFYLARHPHSQYWVDFEDFAFYRMEVVDLYYVGGFGVMGWVPAPEYERAQPDPLAEDADEITRHMNVDHAEALVLLARAFAGMDSQTASMTAVDRLGFNLRLQTRDGARGARIAFLREVRNAGETRDVLVEMVKQARSQAE
ncbi:MAG TPA: DUF2470 domain-containing protein [Terriglobales bacterium]|nr:DUF2470 domain-containing protein [Terriglobales bacterium]